MSLKIQVPVWYIRCLCFVITKYLLLVGILRSVLELLPSVLLLYTNLTSYLISEPLRDIAIELQVDCSLLR